MATRSTVFQRALNRILRKAIASAGEMARVAQCSAQHIRAVARGDANLSLRRAEILSSWLVDERSCTRQVEGMLGLSGATHFVPEEVDHDDCLQDEIYEARQRLGEADQLLKDERRDEAQAEAEAAMALVKAAIEDIKS